MTTTVVVDVKDWLTPGRKTVEGYLYVLRGFRKGKRGGLLDEFLKDVIERSGHELPRYPDLHAVWFSNDREPNWPLLRYRAHRPIDGLRRECHGHRVRLTCTVSHPFHNKLGAYITRAHGECLECEP